MQTFLTLAHSEHDVGLYIGLFDVLFRHFRIVYNYLIRKCCCKLIWKVNNNIDFSIILHFDSQLPIKFSLDWLKTVLKY